MKRYGSRDCARLTAAAEADPGRRQQQAERGGGGGGSGGGGGGGDAVGLFVSTNDMITGAGWMLMRKLSGNQHWGTYQRSFAVKVMCPGIGTGCLGKWSNFMHLAMRRGAGMNIVVNIRGRGGTDEDGFGLFGNGITAATAAVVTVRNFPFTLVPSLSWQTS
jgi:hypothetical protein